MEISKLIICRQDVIVVSDADSESNNVNSKKRKRKRKTTFTRNVKLTTMTVSRSVPSCLRERCKNCERYHRKPSMNTKYRGRETVPIDMKFKRSPPPPSQSTLHTCHKDSNKINKASNGVIYSPITITSSSDTYENISSCSLNIASSDSDELENLITSTRKRMKTGNGNYDSLPLSKSVYAPITEDISSSEDFHSSIHSMDTVLLSHENPNQHHLKNHNNNNVDDPVLKSADNKQNKNIFLQQKLTSKESNDKNNLSPLYEISGKVLMEHYLNTNCI